eukprot:5771285-Amphidinium_carterae.1
MRQQLLDQQNNNARAFSQLPKWKTPKVRASSSQLASNNAFVPPFMELQLNFDDARPSPR